MKLEQNKDAYLFIFLCCLVYCAGYITRINYAAAVSEIVISEGFAKSAAGMVTTAAFASYGIGQLISGVMGDKFNPRRLIFFGLLATAALNLIMPFCSSVKAMGVIWFFNGLAQASLWPPLVKIMSVCLYEDQFQKSCVGVSIASSVGTVAVYFIVPACIGFGGWRMVFYACAGLAVIVAFIWIFLTQTPQKCLDASTLAAPVKKGDVPQEKEGFLKLILSYGLVSVCAAILIHGILKDGVTTWLPSYIIETFHMDSQAAILCAVVLPLMGIFGMQFAARIYQKTDRNEMKLSSVFFLTALISSTLLTVFYAFHAGLSVFLAAIINSCMYAINIMLICMIPARFEKYGKVSTVSGLLNFFTYVGSAVSTYAIAKLSELCGWQITIASWALLCLFGFILCFLGRKKKF